MRCDVAGSPKSTNWKSFNPHTYMRCDHWCYACFPVRSVSIHTPTWGVTRSFYYDYERTFVSIHTPTWGVTFVNLFTPACLSVFQSTHLHEVWLFAVIPKAITDSFNPHTYMRCDCMWSTWNTVLACFNPHTYMRCDLSMNVLSTLYRGFNPHTYMRCDSVPPNTLHPMMLFQSTHLHEVWPAKLNWLALWHQFQSTHLHEVWLLFRWSLRCPSCFNPHTYMRCDIQAYFSGVRYGVSIHTPTWGVTYALEQQEAERKFQSTHLHEVWPV